MNVLTAPTVLTALSSGLSWIVEAPPWTLLLLKITALLTAAWLVHFTLARANPRWRVVLWRGAAIGLIALPWLGLVMPAVEVRVERPDPAPQQALQPAQPVLAQHPPLPRHDQFPGPLQLADGFIGPSTDATENNVTENDVEWVSAVTEPAPDLLAAEPPTQTSLRPRKSVRSSQTRLQCS